MFNPFEFEIEWVDQCVRIPLLPMEYWLFPILGNLLKSVGSLVKLDDHTTHRTRG